MIEKPLFLVKDDTIREVFKHIYSEAEGRKKDWQEKTPTAKDIDERAFKLHWTGTELRLYTKYSGLLYYLSFTAV